MKFQHRKECSFTVKQKVIHRLVILGHRVIHSKVLVMKVCYIFKSATPASTRLPAEWKIPLAATQEIPLFVSHCEKIFRIQEDFQL